MNKTYCYKKCEKGAQVCKEFLQNSDSVFDAASDFELFVEDCLKTCPYKDQLFCDEEHTT
jgi:hypothetical protein